MSVGFGGNYPAGIFSSAAMNNKGQTAPASGLDASPHPKSDQKSGTKNPEQSEPKITVSAGHGGGCGHCIGMNSGLVSPAKLESLKAERYSAIMSHEQAHASAAGGFGGGIHIDYDSNGIAVGGHVPISIPGLDRNSPETSLAAYHTIRSAALAPSDPSGQDMSVAAHADSLIGRAQEAIRQKEDKSGNAVKPDKKPMQANRKPFSVNA